MSEFNKYSTDGGATFLDVEDSNAVHYGEQSKGYVGKNLFKNTGESKTSNNVVFTHNADDSIGLNNTASGTTFYTIGSVASLAGINQNVILSGCPVGGDTNNGYSMGIRTTSNKNVRHENIDIVDTGNGFRFNPSNPLKDSDGNSVSISDLVLVMRIGNGVNVSNKTFYPMIRLSAIPDSTYEPYIHPNTEIPDKMTYADNAVLGAKNFMFTDQKTHTINDGTWTIDSETGVITASGTPTGYSDTNFTFPLIPGVYRIGKIENGVNITWGGYELHKNGQIIYTYTPNLEDGQVIDLTSYDFDEISMSVKRVANNSPISGTVYPMLRLADDTDDTYAPCAMTNRELTKLSKRTKLFDSYDLDNILEYGNYYWGNAIPLHSPDNQNYASMNVYPCGDVIHQEVIRGAGGGASIYVRRWQLGSWSSWYKFTGTAIS